jgi:hypothetical protein
MPITINGNGSIEGLSVGGLPNATVAQADLAAGVASNGPAFSAVKSSSQTISHNTSTTVTFQVETFDTNSNFDIATNRFTPTVAGYYQVNVNLQFNCTLNRTYYFLGRLFKNSDLMFQVSHSSSNVGNGQEVSVSPNGLVFMNGSTDYLSVQVYAFDYTASSSVVVSGTSLSNTNFSACLVRSA